jgi:hypothetical protein
MAFEVKRLFRSSPVILKKADAERQISRDSPYEIDPLALIADFTIATALPRASPNAHRVCTSELLIRSNEPWKVSENH